MLGILLIRIGTTNYRQQVYMDILEAIAFLSFLARKTFKEVLIAVLYKEICLWQYWQICRKRNISAGLYSL